MAAKTAKAMVGLPTRRRIAVITQFYPPEAGAASNRVSAIARALSDAGNDVTVIAALPSFPTGVIPAHYRMREQWATRDGDIDIRYVWTYASPRLRTIDRLLNWLSVAAGATMQLILRRKRFDVVLVSSPPITLALPALAASMLRRARLVVDVRDVYPDVAVKLGVWKRDGMLARSVGAVADMLYRRASLILAASDPFKLEIMARGVPAEKIFVAPNGFDRLADLAGTPAPHSAAGFVVAYAGNMGVATGMHVVLDAARLLQPSGAYRFVLVGGGAESGDLARRIEREQLRNITMLGAQPRDIAQAVVRDADVCLVPLRRGVDTSLPTKLFDALAQGTPVIVCAEGEAKRFVERSGGGIAVPPEDGSALARAIQELAADPARREACGRSGMAYVRANYDRASVASDVARRVCALSSP